MKIEELVPLTNGLSVDAGNQTLVCDRTRVTEAPDDKIDISFWIVGTDVVPRLTLPRQRVALGSPDEIASLMRLVARGALTGERHPRR